MNMAAMEQWMDRVEGGEVRDGSGCSSVTSFLFCSAATAFFMNSVPLPAKDALPLPLDAVPLLDPFKLLLDALGITVEHLVEGLRKCVNELGPEASEAVKKLLVSTARGVVCRRAGLSYPQLPSVPAPPILLPPPPVLTCDGVFPPY